MKTRIYITLLVGLILSLFTVTGLNAAYLEESPPDSGREIYVPPPYVSPYVPPRYPPPPRYGSFYDFVDSLRLASNRPYRYGGLDIYFLRGADFYIQIARNIITLDEAHRRGVIRISETGGGEVKKVRVSSFTGSYILIMAGEIVSGGRQTRTMVKDVLVPPYARNLVVDVYCIEEGRWEETDKGFSPAEPMLDSHIRGKVMREESQSNIWSGIREEEDSARSYSDTHDLLELYQKRGRDRNLMRELRRARSWIPSNSIGMVVYKNGCIIGMDAFYSHSLFLREFDKLFSSYYYTKSYVDCESIPVKGFLNNLRRVSITEDRGYRGAGRLYDISTPGYYGSALDFGGIIHIGIVN
jgi:hypothetical protein